MHRHLPSVLQADPGDEAVGALQEGGGESSFRHEQFSFRRALWQESTPSAGTICPCDFDFMPPQPSAGAGTAAGCARPGRERAARLSKKEREFPAKEDATLSAPKRRLVPEDLYRFVTVSDPQISPDGEVVAFVRTHIDPESQGAAARTSGWCPASGGQPVPFTRGPKNDSVAPLVAGRPHPGLRLRPGRRPADLADRPARRRGPAAHPDAPRGGRSRSGPPTAGHIAFTSAVGPEDRRELLTRAKSEADKKAEEKKAKDEARTFTVMRWRSDAGGHPARALGADLGRARAGPGRAHAEAGAGDVGQLRPRRRHVVARRPVHRLRRQPHRG